MTIIVKEAKWKEKNTPQPLILYRTFFSKINNESNFLCKECWAANICGGECSIISYLVAGNLNSVNKELCTFRKGLILLALKFEHKFLFVHFEIYKNLPTIFFKKCLITLGHCL